MRNKVWGALTAGTIIGVAAGMMMPGMDRSTKRKIRRTGKIVRNVAEDMYDGMRNYRR